MVATKNNFSQMLNKEPKVLHISCHGVDNMTSTMDDNYEIDRKHDGKFLLFENDKGEGELISSKTLSALVMSVLPDLDLVFVAACKSNFVGKIFQNCGAKHVICVRQKSKVLDEAAIAFTKTFYQKLLNQEDICAAFNIAKASVAFMHQSQEADKFQMLKQEELKLQDPIFQNKDDSHVCFYQPMRMAGDLVCMSDHIAVKHVPDKVSNLKGREKQISKIVKLILSGERLIIMLGLHGVGKSALARNAVYYMLERKYFTGGIIFVNLKCVTSFRQLTMKLKKVIIKNFDLSYETLRAELDDVKPENFVEFLTEFFEKTDLAEKLRKKKQSPNSTQHKFFICLDNAEELITHAGEEFRDFISKV